MAQSDVFDPIYILSFLHIFKKILEMHNYSHFLSYFIGNLPLFFSLYQSCPVEM